MILLGLDENGQITKWKDGSGPSTAKGEPTGSDNDILSHMKDRNFKDLVYLINKPPRWNEQVGAYVLNFNGRVTMASVKNFQLVDPDEQNAVVLQVKSVCSAFGGVLTCFVCSLVEWVRMSSRWISSGPSVLIKPSR